MQVNNERVQKAIWKTRLPKLKILLLVIFLIALTGMIILLPKIPYGPSKELVAYVESVGATHGGGGSGTYLICRLENGEKIQVFLDSSKSFSKDTKIIVRSYPRLIGNNKYEFAYVSPK